MLRIHLKEAFSRFHHGDAAWREENITGGRCNAMLARAIEHVVDEIDSRIRFVPRYDQRLKEPVEKVFGLVDSLVEAIPRPLDCERAAYVRDNTVRALFAGPDQMQRIFSESGNVRAFFHDNPGQDRCWALLCMRREEHRQAGMAVIGDRVMRDVLQTVVSFTDHQLMSPGSSESDARSALKSCIFDSLLVHARLSSRQETQACMKHADRLRALQRRLARVDGNDPGARRVLEREIDSVRNEMTGDGPLRPPTPAENLERVIGILDNVEQYVRQKPCLLHIDNNNVLLDENDGSGHRIELSEITIASQPPRCALLVCFPRDELLPVPDFSRMADVFLAS